MNKLVCEICGGDTLVKNGDHFRCSQCGACYSPEQLKSMVQTPAPQPVQKPVPTPKPPRKKAQPSIGQLLVFFDKHRNKLLAILLSLVAVACVICFGLFLLGQINVLPSTSHFKKVARSQLETSVSNEDVTFESLRFESAEAQKFMTREEDPVGYFAYIEGPMTLTVDDTHYENHLDYYRTRFGPTFDPEDGRKWAYTLTGTYKATHREHGPIDGNFRIIYVDFGLDTCLVDVELACSQEELRQDVISHVTAQLLLSYDIQNVPLVEITSIDTRRHNGYYTYYTIYGVASVKDKYGETYRGKFTAKYSYDIHDQVIQKDNIELTELTKAP